MHPRCFKAQATAVAMGPSGVISVVQKFVPLREPVLGLSSRAKSQPAIFKLWASLHRAVGRRFDCLIRHSQVSAQGSRGVKQCFVCVGAEWKVVRRGFIGQIQPFARYHKGSPILVFPSGIKKSDEADRPHF